MRIYYEGKKSFKDVSENFYRMEYENDFKNVKLVNKRITTATIDVTTVTN